MFKNKMLWLCCLTLSITSCASAPKPPECTGEFKPVNQLDPKEKKYPNHEKVVSCNGGASHG